MSGLSKSDANKPPPARTGSIPPLAENEYRVSEPATSYAFPLFLTQQSLKPISGPAVQTAAFAEMFPHWRHLHWAVDHPKVGFGRSFRLQSSLFELWPFAHGAGAYKALLRRLGADWWSGAALKPRAKRRLSRWLNDGVNVIYVAPTTHAQAMRMRGLIEAFGRPFVVHYWDMLDGGMEKAGPDTRWLLHHAQAVFALSDALTKELRPFRPDCRALSFTRGPAAALAKAPVGPSLRIALIGHVAAYGEGLRHLAAALQQITPLGVDARIVYIGPRRQLRTLAPEIRALITQSGFQKTSRARDQVLATCHIAFLSGPTASPELDSRSRFSIPSRLLDFAATGLPIVATVHPRSSCADFLKSWGPKAARVCEGPNEVFDAISGLKDRQTWSTAQAHLLRVFQSLRAQPPEQMLRAELEAIASRGISPVAAAARV